MRIPFIPSQRRDPHGDYKPKFCRTRGCNLPLDHKEKCAGKYRRGETVPMHDRKPRGKGTSVGVVKMHRAPRHVTGTRGVFARAYMAEVRAGNSPEPLPREPVVSRRQQILARRAGK